MVASKFGVSIGKAQDKGGAAAGCHVFVEQPVPKGKRVGKGGGASFFQAGARTKGPLVKSRAPSTANRMFVEAYRADPMEVVQTVKAGVQPEVVYQLARSKKISKEALIETLGLSRATVQRKSSTKTPLSVDASSRVVGITRLIGQVQDIVNSSGDPAGFDAAQWVAAWLEQANPALDGRKPANFMDTAEGQQLVSRLLAQVLGGAYA